MTALDRLLLTVSWIWDWRIAKLYFLIAAYGVAFKLAVIIGWMLSPW